MTYFVFFSTAVNLLLSFYAFYKAGLKLTLKRQRIFLITLIINHATLASWIIIINDDADWLFFSGMLISATGALIFTFVFIRPYLKKFRTRKGW